MSKITIWFLKCAMLYFVAAILIGIYMSKAGGVYPLRPIHTHFNLLGWMSMMIYGVGYHILPRFSGAPLWSEKLSLIHLWLANIGLLGMALGWILIGQGVTNNVLHAFSIIEAISVILFVVNMFKTIKPAPAPAKRTPPKK